MATIDNISEIKGRLEIEMAVIKATTGKNVKFYLSGDKIQVKLETSSTQTVFEHDNADRIRHFIMLMAGSI